MILIAFIWLASIVLVYRISVRANALGCGLPLVVLLTFSFEYLGGFAYIIPDYSHLRPDGSLYLLRYNFTEETVLRGMTVALIGVLAFTSGTVLYSGVRTGSQSVVAVRPFNRVAFAIVLLIGICGLVLTQVNLAVPFAGALQQVGQLSMICAIAFGLYMSKNKIRGRLPIWVALSAALPVYYLFMLGFMSYGFQALIILVVFWMVTMMRRPPSSASFLIYFAGITYLLLLLCVVWLSFREELRAVLWGDAGLSERLDAVFYAVSQISLLNPYDFESVDYLVTRMNHGLWVGKVIETHELNPDLRLHGSGLLLSAFAWLPRFIWPGKPEAGGSSMLEAHTGHEFASGVTFGAGQVVDFYVNFGLWGVIVGFLVLGFFVSWVDRSAASALRSGNLIVAAKYFVLGVCLTRSLSEVFFLISSGLFAVIIFTTVQWMVPQLVAVRRSRSALRRGHRVKRRLVAADPDALVTNRVSNKSPSDR